MISSMYHAIALDIAQRIVNGEFKVGAKLSGRSLLAGNYNVSPETIRKAIALLKDANVVTVAQGKEIVITSSQQAYFYIEHHKNIQSVYSLKQDLEILLTQKHDLDRRLEETLNQIINYSDRLKNLTPYNPLEIRVPAHSHLVGRTITEIQPWQNTGATIVAIRRETEVIISPGPYARIEAEDRLVVVGKAGFFEEFTEFVSRLDDHGKISAQG